jgi:putative glutathione S-transferase
MLNSEFNAFAKHAETDFYPEELGGEIDEINAFIYDNLNNGVYRAGFALTQEAYDEAFDNVFAALDTLEERLSAHRYLLGERLTEADLRLFPTLLRFDLAYHYAFKCNKKHLYEYSNLDNYLRDLYQMPGVAEASFPEAAKRGYWSIQRVNPSGIVPKGPDIDFWAPHDRDRFRKAA